MSSTTTEAKVSEPGIVSAARTTGTALVRHRKLVLWILALPVLALLVGITATSELFYGHLIVITMVFAALATAWNIVGGFAGQLSLGHAGFFGVGAYTSSILFVDHGISPWIGLILGMVFAGLIALLIGIPTFRLHGPYFALATLAMGAILLNMAVNFRELTGGEGGLSIPFDPGWANMTFADRWPYAIIMGAFLLICLGVSFLIANTRLGYQLAAVREDEEAARALGVNSARVKLIAGTVSGLLAGGVGAIYAQYILFINPESVFGINVSIQIIVLAVVGGTGVVLGPLIGAVILVPASQFILRDFGGDLPGLHTLVYGIVVIAVVLFAPRGVHGLIRSTVERLTAFRSRR
jgi:branched-chain amino acid transport system permease protein